MSLFVDTIFAQSQDYFESLCLQNFRELTDPLQLHKCHLQTFPDFHQIDTIEAWAQRFE